MAQWKGLPTVHREVTGSNLAVLTFFSSFFLIIIKQVYRFVLCFCSHSQSICLQGYEFEFVVMEFNKNVN